MGHEDAVYLAKLAEQAERYEGSLSSPLKITLTPVPKNGLRGLDREFRILTCAHRDGREHEGRCLGRR